MLRGLRSVYPLAPDYYFSSLFYKAFYIFFKIVCRLVCTLSLEQLSENIELNWRKQIFIKQIFPDSTILGARSKEGNKRAHLLLF